MANQLQQIKLVFKAAAAGDLASFQLAAQFLQLMSLKKGGMELLQAIALQDPELEQSIQAVIKMMSTKARLGAKLNYILQLTAPKFACGGRVKKKKFLPGGEVTKKKTQGQKVIDKFKQNRKEISKNDTITLDNGLIRALKDGTPYKRLTPQEYRKLSRGRLADVDLKDSAAGRSVN